MNILQVGSGLSDWGGIERYVLYLSEGLAGRGHRVTVTCPPGSPLHLRRFTDPSKGEFLPLRSRGKHDLLALARYVRLLKRRRFDVVHIHFNPDFLVAGWAARLTRQQRVVLTRHVALPWSSAKLRMYLPLFDHIIPVSDAVRRVLADSGVPEARMTVAKAGCPPLEAIRSREAVRAELEVPEDAYCAGCFGRLSPEKGLDVLLEAARALPGTRFAIFGSGPLEQHLRSVAPANVRLYGFRADVADCMAAMDCVVIPSRWDEAFPYSALEAMSLGRPLVVSRVGGLPEIVREEETGLAFDREDASGLAKALEELRQSPWRAWAMGDRARELHRQEYTVAHMAERIERVYEQAS